jgi:hypothetical protein
MSNLRITLVQERSDQAYYSGSTITGNVQLDVAEPKSYKYASIQFGGRSYVYWEERRTETSGNQRRHVIYRYRSEQPFTEQSCMLWTSQQSPDGKLGAGEYSWPFSFTIPPLAPSSFEGTVGNIRYLLEARVGTGILKFDHVVEVRIPVQQLVTISDPRLLLPERFEAEKTLCCMCCASGPITMNASIPKTGFTLRESFSLHVSIENGGSREVTLDASICQKVIYRAQGHQRTNNKTLVSYASDPIEPHASREWDPTIEIPVTEIIHEGSCENIEMHYSLVVAAKIPRALDLSRAIPLQLGNCSVQQQGDTLPAPPTQGAVHLPPTQTEVYPYPPSTGALPYPPMAASTGAPAYPPTATSAPYPPQQPSGNGTNAGTPIGWSTPGGAVTVPTYEKPPDIHDDSPDSASDNETARLL